jgi:LCP family protein required for cell wall assembly
MLAALALSFTAAIWSVTNYYAANVHRVRNVFPAIPEAERPAKQPGNGLTFLLVGLDRRSEVPTTGANAEGAVWKPGEQRSDSLMLVRITADRSRVYVVSIPRDSWVPIPGHDLAKINAAFSYGGPTLLVRTVEKLTGIRIDHLAVIDWDGFRSLTDAVGGVTITIPEDTYDSARRRQWRSGTYTLPGDDALDYVRQRYGLPNGDFDRVARQQNFLRALMDKALQQETLTNPVRLTRMLGSVTDAVTVDDTLSNNDLRSLALSLRHVRGGDVTFLTAPHAGLDRIRGQSVVLLDRDRTRALWQAVRTDALPEYTARYGDSSLGTAVR